MNIEILSVTTKSGAGRLKQHTDELRSRLSELGFSLTDVHSVQLKPESIVKALERSASSADKPDMIVIADALSDKGAESFRSRFAEIVVKSEHAETKPVPKTYWKDRAKAIKTAQTAGEDVEAVKESYRVYRKKARIFSLGEFADKGKGYCFMYKGIRIATLPAVSSCENMPELICLGAVRTKEVFINSAEDYPDGFSQIEYTPRKTGLLANVIPMRGDGAGEVLRKSVVIVSCIVFATALVLLLYNTLFMTIQNNELNGEIQKLYHGETEDGKPDVTPEKGKDNKVDWNKLKNINNEIIGWIQINHTKVDYPVLWHKSDSRAGQYYLNHTYKGDYDYTGYGSIFLDYRCTEGTKSKNTVLHGHHIRDGSMFGDLMKYAEGTSANLDFYKKNPTITYNTPQSDGVYKIISIFKTNTLSAHGEFFNYMVGNFQNDKDFMDYVYNVRIRSMVDCPVDVNEDDTLLTLSTCSYEFTNFRTVIVARKVRSNESEKVDTSKAKLASNPVWPQVYYSSRGGTRPTVTDFCTAYDAGQIKWYNGSYGFKNQKVEKATEPTTQKKNEPTQPVTQAKVYFTVKYINYDGSVISTQKVEKGKDAKVPATPVKPSDGNFIYTFESWGLSNKNVQSNMTIAPKFSAVRITQPVTQAQPDEQIEAQQEVAE